MEHLEMSAAAAEQAKRFDPSDLGNAERLIYRHGKHLRYCKETGSWLVWSGQLWRTADKLEILEFAKETAKSIINEVIEPGVSTTEHHRHARQAQSRRALDNMVYLAQSDGRISVKSEQLDADPWLLGTPLGTIDLRSGRIRENCPEDYLTRSILISPQPGAECHRWRQFIQEVTLGDLELQHYLQRVVGYVLTGSTAEQCFFYLHGTGANGKSTLLNVLSSLMGSYACQAESTTFTIQHGDRVRNDLARMAGARLVTAVEPPASRALDDSLLKQITGGDPMAVRYLYAEHFEYRPTCKVFLAANVLPKPTGLDNGVWRRLRCIPFRLCLQDGERDPRLQEALLAELPGILNWAIQGCLEWRRVGLREPQELTVAIQEYRSSRDLLGRFLSECCLLQPGARVLYADLYRAYETWCAQTGEHPATKPAFGQELRDRGYVTRSGGQRKTYWLGIALAERAVAGEGALVPGPARAA